MNLIQHSRYTYTVRHVSVLTTTIIGEGNTTDHTNTAIRRCPSAHAHTAILRVRLQHRALYVTPPSVYRCVWLYHQVWISHYGVYIVETKCAHEVNAIYRLKQAYAAQNRTYRPNGNSF